MKDVVGPARAPGAFSRRGARSRAAASDGRSVGDAHRNMKMTEEVNED